MLICDHIKKWQLLDQFCVLWFVSLIVCAPLVTFCYFNSFKILFQMYLVHVLALFACCSKNFFKVLISRFACGPSKLSHHAVQMCGVSQLLLIACVLTGWYKFLLDHVMFDLGCETLLQLAHLSKFSCWKRGKCWQVL